MKTEGVTKDVAVLFDVKNFIVGFKNDVIYGIYLQLVQRKTE